jgi:Na+/H+ antiporter NhaD/arsenite permease-like protein
LIAPDAGSHHTAHAMTHGPAIPLIIFALTYLVIAIGKLPFLRIDRTGAALTGAVAMIVSGTLGESEAARAIDVHTLALLLGMMIVVANLRLSGAFALFARALLDRARTGYGLLAITIAASGLLAAFFINDVVCLTLTPLLIDAAAVLETDAAPFLLALATASNIGSAATITGNPQNMIVAGFAHLDYLGFAGRLTPVAIVGLAIDYVVIAAAYRPTLAHVHRRHELPPAPRAIRPLVIKSSLVTGGALACFTLGLPTDLVAMAAGAALLFTRRIKPERVYRMIDWTMLVMFAGLFIVVAGFEQTGVQNDLIRAVGVARLAQPVTLSAAVAILSNLVSNVPAVLVFRPLYPLLGATPAVAILIASASTFAGNLTVVGSIANLIVIEQARLRGVRIGFADYLRVGLPVALATLAINIVFLRFGI